MDAAEDAPLLALWREWCREQPEAPWLFHCPEWDWRWRSLARVGDQAARGAASIAAWRGDASTPEPARSASSLHCWLGAHPDAIAGLLAILASGLDATLDSSLDPSDDARATLIVPRASGDGPHLPACRDQLDRAPLEALHAPDDPASTGGDGGVILAGRRLSQRQLIDRSLEIDQRISTDLAPHDLAHVADPQWAGLSSSQQAIVLTSPRLSAAAMAMITAWSLKRHTAWAFETHPSAFVATALWARPHVVIAREDEIQALAAAFDGTARRHSRLVSAIIEEEIHSSTSDEESEQDRSSCRKRVQQSAGEKTETGSLQVPVHRWTPNVS